jgi:hypothetical protein
MTNRYFTPADFSDFEDMNVLSIPEKSTDVMPTPEEMTSLRSRLEHEFKSCEAGLSKLCSHTVQASTTSGTKNLFSAMFNNFGSKSILEFLEMTKQDYGLLVAEWAATQVLGPYCPKAVALAGEWRNRG